MSTLLLKIVLVTFLCITPSHAGSFLEGDLFDFALGPGFEGGTNIRINSTLKGQLSDHYSGLIPLYHIRLGPISVTNTYEVQEFTTGNGWRAGALITIRGHPYEAVGVQKRRESLFSGSDIKR